jgi:hypothetical protein
MSKAPEAEHFMLDGPAGKLEAILESPVDGELRGSVVICHPHPQHGGTMENKVVHMLARAFVGKRMAALRFNYRGVGQSDGTYDEGNGELHDAIAATRWLQQRHPGLPLWLSGFSFGAALAIRLAMQLPAVGLVSVAPAVSRFAAGLDRQPDCPWLIIQGDSDELVDVDETIEWVNGLAPGPELQVFDDTDHFFHGRLLRLRSAVEEFIDRN